jgi:hypothetical protein
MLRGRAAPSIRSLPMRTTDLASRPVRGGGVPFGVVTFVVDTA